MPDTAQNKSEAPTTRRREDARKEGQVALSTELTSGLLLLSGVAITSLAAQSVGEKLTTLFRYQLAHTMGVTSWSAQDTYWLGSVLARYALGVVGMLLLGTFVAGVAANVLQIGFQVSTQTLSIKWSRLSPASGMKRIFSLRAVVRTLVGIVKLLAVSVAVTWALYGRGLEFFGSARTLPDAVADGWDTAVFAALVAASVLTVVGTLDYAFQRWQHEQDLRMSRREVQEEHKQEEGDPLIRSRVRKLQRERSKQQMLREVPEAAVVLTNPTHLAVAIRYQRGVTPAPRVVAKGDGLLAKQIVRVARKHGVPVLERKPLARALFASAELGQEIPVALYRAIAEILAFVYQLPASRSP